MRSQPRKNINGMILLREFRNFLIRYSMYYNQRCFSVNAVFGIALWAIGFFVVQSQFLKIIGTLLYVIPCIMWCERIVSRWMFRERNFSNLFYGGFLFILLLSFGLAVPIVVYKITPLYFLVYLIILGGI